MNWQLICTSDFLKKHVASLGFPIETTLNNPSEIYYGYSYRYLKPRTFIHFNIKNVNLENLQKLLQIKTINI